MEALRSHSPELVNVVAMDSVGVYYRGGMSLFDWLLSDLDTIVYNEKRIVCAKNLII